MTICRSGILIGFSQFQVTREQSSFHHRNCLLSELQCSSWLSGEMETSQRELNILTASGESYWIGQDYLGEGRETLAVLRFSPTEVTTLCLGFKNCTVALFFRYIW